MSAIITSKFRLENASAFIKSVTDESVYLMVGKSDAWSDDKVTTTDSAAPTPLDAQVEQNDVWQNAIALKKLGSTDVINVAPRHTWTFSTVYPSWDDALEDNGNFYVINGSYDVFKCLKTPINAGSPVASTIEPTTTNSYQPFKTTDGYIWKYMFSVFTTESSKFLTNTYIPVKTVVIPQGGSLGDLTDDEQVKYQYQSDCAQYTTGKIYRYVVESGGSGYASAPTVNVFGNGTGAHATAVVSGGQVTEVYVTGEPTMTSNFTAYNNNCGTGYSSVYVTLNNTGTGGSGAVVRAVLSPKNGHGSDPVKELGAFYVASRIVLSGAEGSGDFIVGNAFRQIAMVKNPYDYDTTDISTATTMSALKSLTVAAGHTAFLPGDYITGGTSGAVAFVDLYTLQNDSTGLIKYHQNDKTGYAAFNDTANPTNGETISGAVQGSGSIAAASIADPEVQPFSGDVMFIESRAPINRSTSQIEDLRIIVEF